MHDWRSRSVLYGGGPYYVLQRRSSGVHVNVVVAEYFRSERIVMSSLNELVLAFLKCIRLIRGNSFPARREICGSGYEILKILEPWKVGLRHESFRRAGLSCHLVRTIGHTTRIAGAGRHRAWSTSACFVFCGKYSQLKRDRRTQRARSARTGSGGSRRRRRRRSCRRCRWNGRKWLGVVG